MQQYTENQCGFFVMTGCSPDWEEKIVGEKYVSINEQIWQTLSRYATTEVGSIFLHIGYCDFRSKKCKTPLRFSYSAKEKQIRVTYFVNYPTLKIAYELDNDVFLCFYEIIRLDAIIAASKKYKIPEENYRELVERRSKLGTIPEWIPEMEDNPQLVIDMYKASVPK